MGLRFQTKKEVKTDLSKQSGILTLFYQDILKWTEQEMHLRDFHDVYLPWYGLCSNLYRYLNATYLDQGAEFKDSIQSEMFRQLKQYAEIAGTSTIAAFNKSEGEYRTEVRSKTTFLNIYRIRWIQDHAKGKS